MLYTYIYKYSHNFSCKLCFCIYKNYLPTRSGEISVATPDILYIFIFIHSYVFNILIY